MSLMQIRPSPRAKVWRLVKPNTFVLNLLAITLLVLAE